ncbi:hypothetical protein BW730_06960 [Tessaracoccus aquimaris]|uniref:Helicase HerA central domain-containing protein n=1 Tax=Tessaracoccus aquimaris TaxID=1332264 RepID=A0A1Q2CMI6_9ACTN|nr:hypothetical protein BW730_06960 [Tessaracoccus aquimaris]
MNRSGLVWRQLVLPVPADEARVRSFLSALVTATGSPTVAFEAIGSGGQVLWRLGTEPWAVRDIHALALAHLPGVRLLNPSQQHIVPESERVELHLHRAAHLASDVVATRPPAAAAALRFNGTVSAPLRVEATETVTRSLLSMLASAKGKESIRLQLVCGGRLKPRTPTEQLGHPKAAREVQQHLGEPGFVVALRVSASASSESRARALVRTVAASLKGLEVPGSWLRIWKSSLSAVVEARSSWWLPMPLRISELPAFLAWPLTEGLPGVASAHPVLMPPSPAIPSQGRLLGQAATEAQGRPVALTAEDSLRHLHLLGPTGVGKSTMMAHLALQDIAAGRGVVVIDPKGDLVADIASRIPSRYMDEVVILDAADEAPVGINPLAGARNPDLAADVLLGVMHSLYADSWGPRTHDILHACLLTLARRGDASLVVVPLLLTNPGFRRSVTGRVAKHDPMGLGGFWAWFEAMSDGERQQAIAPLMNKLRPILLRPQLRAVFGQRRPRFDMTDIFGLRSGHTEAGHERPRVVLVNLAKGALGEEAARLLGSIVVALVWQAAVGRAGLQAFQRRPVMVHIDEVQDYLRLPGDLGSALAQARGLGVGFSLAHQHLGQLPKDLKAGVMANARSRVAFSLSRDDARAIAALSQGTLKPEDYQSLPRYHAYASLLVNGEAAPPFSLRTTALGSPVRSLNSAQGQSRARFGQSLSDVEQNLLDLVDGGPGDSVPTGDQIGRVRRPGGTGADGRSA